MNKKVGIVTWYWGNYGSILQAYALQNAIKSIGLECEVIQHHVNGNIRMQIRYRILHQGILNTLKYYLNKSIAKLQVHNKKEITLRCNALNDFIEKNIKLSSQIYNNKNYSDCQNYKYYVCGSDQIWNPNFTFFSSFYWLGFVKNGEKIAYAPSMGKTVLRKSEEKMIAKYLQSFKAISVRESKTSTLLNKILSKDKVITVSDPTMLIKADIWKEKVPSRRIKEKYLFAYLIRGNKEQRDYISTIAKQRKLVLVTYPYLEGNYINKEEKAWGDIRCSSDDPFDFLEKIFNAELIITDSFHCSVFSLLFHKDFYVLKKRMIQLISLQDSINYLLYVRKQKESKKLERIFL